MSDIKMHNHTRWLQYVDLLMSMGLAEKMKNGPEPEAFVMNLRIMADQMEELLNTEKGVNQP